MGKKDNPDFDDNKGLAMGSFDLNSSVNERSILNQKGELNKLIKICELSDEKEIDIEKEFSMLLKQTGDTTQESKTVKSCCFWLK